ncbi:MAG: UvrD-helicase domain-containing protein [Puniceicoccales bacterium]|nr:UvrD-helicase domain-containing protein [Puniceicoccales bacterium]
MRGRILNEAILASAGSGKTYQLSSRIIRLLATGAEPSSILALTFTRKAAGEFARRVFLKIADAASSEETALRLATEIGPGDAQVLGSLDFANLLAQTLQRSHQLKLSTFDAFFQQLARVVSVEIGLVRPFSLLDERLEESAKDNALRFCFRRELTGNTTHRDFLAVFRNTTWGYESGSLQKHLRSFVTQALSLLHSFPEHEAWGDKAAVFGGAGCPWFPVPEKEELIAALEQLIAYAQGGAPPKRLGQAILKFAQNAASWHPGSPISEFEVSFFRNLLPKLQNAPKAENGKLLEVVYYGVPTRLPQPISAAFLVLARHIIGGSLAHCLRIAKSSRLLLEKYDASYDHLIRCAGWLTFEDFIHLLEKQRFDFSLRLDARIDHWLFDEFQDTSPKQWGIIEDNLDQVLTDESGERSAFFVGDEKQALYGWRGGDFKLLRKLHEHYAHCMGMRPLNNSWRSSPGVLELVNAVFGALKGGSTILPETQLEQCWREWEEHKPAGEAQTRKGWSAWHVCPKCDTRGEDMLKRLECTFELLQGLLPLQQKLTVGLLTQDNDEAKIAIRFLRERGVRVSADSDVSVCTDNPVSLVFLALLGMVAHPGDTLSVGIVAMAPPMAHWLAKQRGAVHERLLSKVAARGISETLQSVMTELGDTLPNDAFSSLRCEQLLAIAQEFDATGSRDIDEFIRYARRSRLRDNSDSSSVQVMTIHKAKGLEFDAVFLPFLEGNRLNSARTEEFATSPAQAPSPWVMASPNKFICESTPVLDAHLWARQNNACHESLCKLYVALTRARHAVHVITTWRKTESLGVNYHVLLARTLGLHDCPGDASQPVWQAGEADWASSLR